MTENSVRPAPRAVRIALGVLIALGITFVLAGEVRARVPWPERQVAMPPVTATPEEVVRTFVDALDARDIDTAKALSTRDHARSTENNVDSWYRNIKSIKNLEVLRPWRDQRHGYAEAVFVPVYFDLQQHREESMENGHMRWGYLLVRNSSADRWLVADQGPA